MGAPSGSGRGGISATDRLSAAGTLAWHAVGLGAAVAGVVWLLSSVRLIVVPLLLATVLAAVSTQLVDRLQRLGVRRSIGAGTLVLTGTSASAAVVYVSVPALVRQTQTLAPKAQAGLAGLLDWLEQRFPTADLAAARNLLADPLGQLSVDFAGLTGQALPVVGRVGELLTMLALTLVFWFFLTRDAALLADALLSLAPAPARGRWRRALTDSWQMLRQFLKGTTLVAGIDAAGIGVGLALLGVPAAGVLTLLVFLGGFIPVVGAAASGLLAVLVALAAGGFPLAAAVLTLVVVVQQVESNVLQPMIMRRMVRLHPMVTLAALSIGALQGGVLGAFLAVPLTAAIAAALRSLRTLPGEPVAA